MTFCQTAICKRGEIHFPLTVHQNSSLTPWINIIIYKLLNMDRLSCIKIHATDAAKVSPAKRSSYKGPELRPSSEVIIAINLGRSCSTSRSFLDFPHIMRVTGLSRRRFYNSIGNYLLISAGDLLYIYIDNG